MAHFEPFGEFWAWIWPILSLSGVLGLDLTHFGPFLGVLGLDLAHFCPILGVLGLDLGNFCPNSGVLGTGEPRH